MKSTRRISNHLFGGLIAVLLGLCTISVTCAQVPVGDPNGGGPTSDGPGNRSQPRYSPNRAAIDYNNSMNAINQAANAATASMNSNDSSDTGSSDNSNNDSSNDSTNESTTDSSSDQSQDTSSSDAAQAEQDAAAERQQELQNAIDNEVAASNEATSQINSLTLSINQTAQANLQQSIFPDPSSTSDPATQTGNSGSTPDSGSGTTDTQVTPFNNLLTSSANNSPAAGSDSAAGTQVSDLRSTFDSGLAAEDSNTGGNTVQRSANTDADDQPAPNSPAADDQKVEEDTKKFTSWRMLLPPPIAAIVMGKAATDLGTSTMDDARNRVEGDVQDPSDASAPTGP
jgi:flagellar biosynthesis GTPase FlhF